MKIKFEKLSNIFNVGNAQDLYKKDYISCGFSDDEAEILEEIYHSLIGIKESNATKNIDFINKNFDFLFDIRIKYYFEFYLCKKALDNNKYSLTKKLVNLVIENHKSIFNVGYVSRVESSTLNELLISSTKMSFKTEELLKIVYWYCMKTGEISNFSKSIECALFKVKNPMLDEKFLKLHERWIEMHLKKRDVYSVENYINSLEKEKNKFFNGNSYKKELYKQCLELGSNNRGIEGLEYLKKAVEGFTKINDNYNKDKALYALQMFIKDNDIEWHESVWKFNDNDIKKIEAKIYLLNVFLQSLEIREIILTINKSVNFEKGENGMMSERSLIYMPYPDYASIKGQNKSSITNMFTQSTIGDGRIIKNTSEPKYRDTYYNFNVKSCVIPVMERIETEIDKFVKCVNDIITDSQWIGKSTKKYLQKTVTFYDKEKSFEFMHAAVILIERLLRDIYQKLNGSNITPMKTASYAQINVNFQDIMKNNKIKDFFGENMYKYIEYNLIDERGLNLRNDILHGLVDIEIFQHHYSRILMHIILVIIVHTNENLNVKGVE